MIYTSLAAIRFLGVFTINQFLYFVCIMKPSDLLFFSAATATLAIAEPKALPFGAPAPVQVLRPRLEYVKYLNDDNSTETSYSKDPKPRISISRQSATAHSNKIDEGDDDDEDAHWGFSFNSLNPLHLFRLNKRQTRDCGTFVLDCAHARGVCNNACYYQNCLNAGQTIRYQDYGGDEDANKQNRVDAGTTVNLGTPCRNMPLSQRMWDSWPGWDVVNPNLQTDEWPMAAMEQARWDDDDDDVRNTLRCIPGNDNRSTYVPIPS